MATKPSNHLLRWLLVLNLVVFGFLGARHGYRLYQERAKMAELRRENAAFDASIGIASYENLMKSSLLRDRVVRGKKLSDAEFDWCFAQMEEGGQRGTIQGAMRQSEIRSLLTEAARYQALTPAQHERVYQWAVDRLAQDTPSDREGKATLDAVSLFRALGDPRALPLLRPYQNDPRDRVKSAVVSALKALDRAQKAQVKR